jgi:hypothetical protein
MSEQEKMLVPAIEQPVSTGPASPEVPASPEPVHEHPEGESAPATAPTIPAATPRLPDGPIPPEVERAKAIEKILEEDLSDVYFNLPEDKREQFRIKGEATTLEINRLLSATKIKVDKIVKLIRSWLMLIPGVNKFFLEQEAKLKADQILKINDKF